SRTRSRVLILDVREICPCLPNAQQTRCERTGHRDAEQRDEVAAPHSIISSARASSVGGTSRPSAGYSRTSWARASLCCPPNDSTHLGSGARCGISGRSMSALGQASDRTLATLTACPLHPRKMG